jgi:hypothetical protein
MTLLLDRTKRGSKEAPLRDKGTLTYLPLGCLRPRVNTRFTAGKSFGYNQRPACFRSNGARSAALEQLEPLSCDFWRRVQNVERVDSSLGCGQKLLTSKGEAWRKGS